MALADMLAFSASSKSTFLMSSLKCVALADAASRNSVLEVRVSRLLFVLSLILHVLLHVVVMSCRGVDVMSSMDVISSMTCLCHWVFVDVYAACQLRRQEQERDH